MCKKLIYLTCFVLVLSLAGSASAQLMVHYKLDETSGNTAFDSSGKGNNGTISGTPGWVAGKVDGAMEFSGDDNIVIPAANFGIRSNAGSVAFWMNMTAVLGGINTIWWGGDNITGSGFGPENEMHIHIETTVGNIWIGGELCFAGQSDPANFHLHSDPNKGDPAGNPPVSPILVNDSNWHHVACTWGNDDGNAKLFLDGTLLHQMARGTRSYPLNNMFIGQMAGGGRRYNGLLDEIQIYGRAITQEEIHAIIAGTPALSFLASLPEPSHQAVDVPRDTVLKWFGGDTAAKHNVYLGKVFEDVNAASLNGPRGVLVSQNQTAVTYNLNTLEWDTTYYWRIDEVEADGNTIHKGNVWSFTVCNFLIVDDFEIYDANNTIFSLWSDYAVNNTGMTVGYFSPPYVEQALGFYHSGKQSMPLRYDNDGTVNEETTYQKSGTLKYSEAERKWTSPQNWTVEDVNSLSLWLRGYPAYVGGFVEQPAGSYTLKSTGADIWGNSDQFHFAHKEVASGACSIIAKVESLDPNIDPNELDTKAGIMIRDSLDPNASNAALVLTPAPDRGLRYQYRLTTAGTTQRLAEDLDPNAHAPYWLRLDRTAGGLIRAYRSPDGTQWRQFTLRTVTMSMPIYIGLAVTSHDVTRVYEAKFSNVSFPNNATLTAQPWKDRDIGIMSNENEPMYVVINGNAVVYNNDPNAALINQWTEWKIDLKRFTNLGVNLTGVSSFGIGLGNRANPQRGGTGTLYIDDIRLYRP